MKPITAFIFLLSCIQINAQDTTTTVVRAKPEKMPVQIFNSDRAILANTTETIRKGNLAFRVSHHFGDIGGNFGGLKNFFGLDNAVDFRIGFALGLGDKLDLMAARIKGASLRQQEWELAIKWKMVEQAVGGPGFSMALFANHVVATNTASTFPNRENSYKGFSERSSNAFQLIIAKKIGKVSLQLNPTVVTRGYTISYDQDAFFALGGAGKIPLIENKLNFLFDYFHPFRSDAVKDSFRLVDIHFADPVGVGFEFVTPGHHFRLNFTNATEILENRFIPRTITSWGDGQFRWAFTISRTFRLWLPKK
jgi:hypothetical protein